MAESLLEQIDQLRLSITGLEAQRSILGDAIVNPALAALQKQLAELEQQAAQQAAPADERRMVTILFIDMVGSTSMAENLDPEEWRKVISQVHATLGETINAHHGTVAQFLGDGILAFFGSKETSEHDPENAVRAALEAHTAIASSGIGENVQIRAGIHTGLVVVGELGNAAHKEFTASGDAMNLAARLQSAAPAGGTLISQDTYRYVRGVFDMTPRPPLNVKGKSETVQTFLVRRAKPRPFRSVARGVAGMETRTVGREAELEALHEAYLCAYQDHDIVWAQLLGEPGVGKSRLLVEMIDWLDLREENSRILRARSFPDDVNQPFALIRRMWFDRFQIAEDAPLKQAEAKWVERFKELSGIDDFTEPAQALGLLVGLTFEDSPYIKGMRNDPTQVKGRALVVSRDLIRIVRERSSVILLLEDLQWADQASWEYLMEVFISEVSEEQPNGLFILGAARPEWQPPEKLKVLFRSSSFEGKNKCQGIVINLAPLTDQSTRDLAEEIFQRVENVPEQVINLLVERSEGIPYFTEEIVNWFIDHEILDTNAEPWCFKPEKLKSQPLPSTLQQLLLTRLSSLSQPERAILQRGAIFGRRFWTGGVEALGISETAETLSHLQPRGFVEAQPESSFDGDTEWSFHHNLLQEVTYESVLKRERAELHRVAAGWLEKQARQAGRLEEFAGLLGDHYERAGELSSAADWYLLAGKRAMGQGAPREAAYFYTQTLKLLPPIDQERRWQAFSGREDALGILGEADLWKEDIDALIELARTFEDDNYLAEAYLRQAIYEGRVAKPTAGKPAMEAYLAAQRCGNEAIEAKALSMMAIFGIELTDREATIKHIEQALNKARMLADDNVLSFVLFRAAFCFSELGDLARGMPLQTEQIELDHRLGNRNQEAIGMHNLSSNYFTIGQYRQARLNAEQSIQLCKALGARRPLAYNYLTLGGTYQAIGDMRKARQLLEEALQVMSIPHDVRGLAFIYNCLAMVLIDTGDVTGAMRRLNETIELGKTYEREVPTVTEAKIYLAACFVMQGKLVEASTIIHESFNILREHGWIGMAIPPAVYRTCAETFDALGEAENLQAALEIGHQAIMEVADKIGVPEWRQSFLENVPDNRVFLEMWERSQASR